MATWKKITTEADLTAVSASLTTTDQTISSSVATLSGSASDARNLLATQVSTGLSGSASDARDLAASQVSGSFNLLSGSLTITDVAISSSVAILSGSASDARNVLGLISGSASDARNLLVTKISGSSTLPISNLSASLTTTDQTISASVAALSGSASAARDLLGGTTINSTDNFIPIRSDATTFSDSALKQVSIEGNPTFVASTLAISSSTTVEGLGIKNNRPSVNLNTLVGTRPAIFFGGEVRPVDRGAANQHLQVSNNGTTLQWVDSISGSASTARDLLASQVSGSFTAVSASLTTTDQTISASVATLSGSASDARDLLVSQATTDNIISFNSQDQGRFNFTQGGNSSLYDVIGLKPADDVTFNDIQVNGEATIEGDLTVKGTTTSINTTNLLVSDKFALFASGSTAVTDGGVIIQSDVNGTGKALGFSQANSRWSLQSSLAHNATTFSSVDAFLGTVETSTAVPSATPVYGVGTIHVKTDTEDIYIYS